jgi:hypothetical protein
MQVLAVAASTARTDSCVGCFTEPCGGCFHNVAAGHGYCLLMLNSLCAQLQQPCTASDCTLYRTLYGRVGAGLVALQLWHAW